MARIAFNVLWNNHPGDSASFCSYTNQCAVRMGETFRKSGIKLSSFTGARCWDKTHRPRHILRAQELANWMTHKRSLFGNRKILKELKSRNLAGKRGIVFIRDGWGATDHIDLWNGSALKGGKLSWLNLGKELWFWEI